MMIATQNGTGVAQIFVNKPLPFSFTNDGQWCRTRVVLRVEKI